jgi:hypothetical protein
LDGQGSIPDSAGFFCSPQRPDRLWDPRYSMVISPGVKRLCREADHSPPSSVEVKNGGVIPPLPICLHGVLLN